MPAPFALQFKNSAGQTGLLSGDNPAPVIGYADAQQGTVQSVVVELGAAGVASTVALPDSARGFRISSAANCRFAVDEDPADQAQASGPAVAAGAFAVGNVLVAGQPEVRILAFGEGRTLHLRSATPAAVVTVEVY